MVKTGKFTVKQAPLSARLGTGFGAGLSESIPKEAERYRLRKGLESFAEQAPGLSPLQAFSQLSAIPGVTPQMIQAMPELLKMQSFRQGLTGSGSRGQDQSVPSRSGVPTGFQGERINIKDYPPPETIPDMQVVQPGEISPPQAFGRNPLSEEAVPLKRWDPDRYLEELGNLAERFPMMSNQELMQMAQENEQRYLAQPEDVQKQNDYLRKIRNEANDALDQALRLKLQAKPEEQLFSKLDGNMLNNLQRSMQAELAKNPELSIDDVANRWSEKGLQMAKEKTALDTELGKSSIDRMLNKGKTVDKLKSFAKVFAETGNQHEYANQLVSRLGLSRSAAESIAYPLSPSTQKYLDSILKSGNQKDPRFWQKVAADLQPHLTQNDSIQAITWYLNNSSLEFNSPAFFNQLSQEMDMARFSDDQKRQINQGPESNIKNWADFLYMPGRYK